MSQYVRYPSNSSTPSGGTANQLLGENASASALEFKTLSGTVSQVVVTNAPNLITLSLPQDIATGSSPTFAGITLDTISGMLQASSGVVSALANGTANQVLGMNNAGTAREYKTIAGTSNEITVTHAANLITLSTPQAIGTGSTPTFAGMFMGGDLLPTTDNAYDIGSLTGPRRFRNLTIVGDALVGGNLHVQGNFQVDGTFTPPAVLLESDGSIGAPAYSFSNQTTMGVYRKASNILGFTTNGTSGINMGGTQLISNNNASTTIDFNGAGAGRLTLVSASDLTLQSGSHLTQVAFEDESHGCNAFYGYLRMSNTYGATGMDIWWQTDGGGDIGRSSLRPNNLLLKNNATVGGKVLTTGGLGVGNSATASTPGTVVKKVEIFDAAGSSLGFIAVYDAIS